MVASLLEDEGEVALAYLPACAWVELVMAAPARSMLRGLAQLCLSTLGAGDVLF